MKNKRIRITALAAASILIGSAATPIVAGAINNGHSVTLNDAVNSSFTKLTTTPLDLNVDNTHYSSNYAANGTLLVGGLPAGDLKTRLTAALTDNNVDAFSMEKHTNNIIGKAPINEGIQSFGVGAGCDLLLVDSTDAANVKFYVVETNSENLMYDGQPIPLMSVNSAAQITASKEALNKTVFDKVTGKYDLTKSIEILDAKPLGDGYWAFIKSADGKIKSLDYSTSKTGTLADGETLITFGRMTDANRTQGTIGGSYKEFKIVKDPVPAAAEKKIIADLVLEKKDINVAEAKKALATLVPTPFAEKTIDDATPNAAITADKLPVASSADDLTGGEKGINPKKVEALVADIKSVAPTVKAKFLLDDKAVISDEEATKIGGGHTLRLILLFDDARDVKAIKDIYKTNTLNIPVGLNAAAGSANALAQAYKLDPTTGALVSNSVIKLNGATAAGGTGHLSASNSTLFASIVVATFGLATLTWTKLASNLKKK